MTPEAFVSELPSVGPVFVKRLEKLGIYKVGDLLYHIPFRYDDFREIYKIANFPLNQVGSVKGEILEFKNQYTKQGKRMQIVEVYDGTGHIYAIWFNQPFLSRILPPGTNAYFSGKMGYWNRKKAIFNPDFEIITEGSEPIHTARLVPIYHETYGVSSKWLRHKLHPLLKDLQIEEFLPSSLLSEHQLAPLIESIQRVHFPKTIEEAGEARKRLAFDELLHIQIDAAQRRIAWQRNEAAHKLYISDNLKKDFISKLPFELTEAQKRSIDEILTDLGKPHPMNRLLEGDVGSGKTVVAAAAAYASYHCGYKTIFMAPTQILANQHFHTLQALFSGTDIGIGLVTSSEKKSTQNNPSILIGTHALLHTKEKLKKIALVIIDEQHRFGVRQRAHLIKKTKKGQVAPHMLTMTATPIPRTVALTLYGDLDLSVIDQLPKGRILTKTWVVPPQKREGAYDWIEKQLVAGDQVFIVCPLIEDSESESLKSVKSAKAEFIKLKKIFARRRLGILHGKMKAKEKDQVVADFRAKKLDILVTTPVVEVGVDIPNATVMVIEAAERFGLASLHQLRGRVGRGAKQSYCLLFTENQTEEVTERLSAMKDIHSGFKLAEFDLSLRGPGELTGVKQHGFADLKIASWGDHALIMLSRQVAQAALDNPIKFDTLLRLHKSRQLIEN